MTVDGPGGRHGPEPQDPPGRRSTLATRNQHRGGRQAVGREPVPAEVRGPAARTRADLEAVDDQGGAAEDLEDGADPRRPRPRPPANPMATAGAATSKATSATVELRLGRMRVPATVGARWIEGRGDDDREEPEHVEPGMGRLEGGPVGRDRRPAGDHRRREPDADRDLGQGDGVGDEDEGRAATEGRPKRREHGHGRPGQGPGDRRARRRGAAPVAPADTPIVTARVPTAMHAMAPMRMRGEAGATWARAAVKNGRTAAIAQPAAPARTRWSAAHGPLAGPDRRRARRRPQAPARNAAATRTPANVRRRSSERRMTRGRDGAFTGTGACCTAQAAQQAGSGVDRIDDREELGPCRASVQRIAVTGLDQAERAAPDEVEGVGDDRDRARPRRS